MQSPPTLTHWSNLFQYIKNLNIFVSIAHQKGNISIRSKKGGLPSALLSLKGRSQIISATEKRGGAADIGCQRGRGGLANADITDKKCLKKGKDVVFFPKLILLYLYL